MYRGILREVEGVPYRHLGRDCRGLDCLGHIYWVSRRLGLPFSLPPEAESYPRDFWRRGIPHAYLDGLLEQFALIPDRCSQMGDWWVFVAKPGRTSVVHTAAVMDPGIRTFQHVWRDKRMSMNSVDETYWRDRFYGTIRHRRMGDLMERARVSPRALKL